MSTGGLGGGDKRSVNAELNLVSYIDLLSTLICFLLLTAVWQQLAAVSTNGNNAATGESASPPDEKKVELSVSLFTDRVDVTYDKQVTSIANVDRHLDYARISQIFVQWRRSLPPTRKDVTLHSDNRAPYKDMIGLMDALAEHDFSDIGVNTN